MRDFVRRLGLLVALLCILPIPAFSQQPGKPLTNQDIVDMTDLGLSDDVIITKINTAAEAGAIDFDTSAEALKFLKVARVSDAVIKVIIHPPAPAKPAVPAPAPRDPNLPPEAVGLYWRNGATFVVVEGHRSSQTKTKVGGGRVAAAGLLGYSGRPQVHENITLDGATSPSLVKDHHPVFYFYLPEGTIASDFVLIRLNKKSDRREFQINPAGGGGTTGVKKEDKIPFKSERADPQSYKITFDADLKPGEYAFLLNNGGMATGGMTFGGMLIGNPADRIYDFSVPE